MSLRSSGLIAAFLAGMLVMYLLPPGGAQAQGVDSVSASWGSVKGALGNSLIFEESNGTVRLYDVTTRRTVTIFR